MFLGLGVVNIQPEKDILGDKDFFLDRDTSIRIKKNTKSLLDRLDFVSKGDSYNSIILELIGNYKNDKDPKDVTLHERTN